MTNQVISVAGIDLDATASSKEEAVSLCADKLIELKAVLPEYKKAMHEREQIISSYVGSLVAIPHGTNQSRSVVNFDQIVFLKLKTKLIGETDRSEFVVGLLQKMTSTYKYWET